jgi:hypothetical protein
MSVVTILAVVLILLALGFVVTGALNLYSADPAAKGVQLGLFAVALVFVGVAFAVLGAAWAVALFVLVVVAQLLFVLRRRSTA